MSLRIGLCAAFALSALLLPASVLAAKPIHSNYSGSYTDANFCGTGKTVNIAYAGVENLWTGPNAYEKSTGQEKDVYTNPLNGNTAEVSSSGPLTVQLVADTGGGYTYIVSYRGVQEQIKAGKGKPVLSKDAGYLSFYDHFDASDNYLGTDVVSHGPHPEADSDFTLFCSVMTGALGL